MPKAKITASQKRLATILKRHGDNALSSFQQRAAATLKDRYGDDYYKRIGAKGGRKSWKKGFLSNKVGKDGLTGVQRARAARGIHPILTKKEAAIRHNVLVKKHKEEKGL